MELKISNVNKELFELNGEFQNQMNEFIEMNPNLEKDFIVDLLCKSIVSYSAVVESILESTTEYREFRNQYGMEWTTLDKLISLFMDTLFKLSAEHNILSNAESIKIPSEIRNSAVNSATRE